MGVTVVIPLCILGAPILPDRPVSGLNEQNEGENDSDAWRRGATWGDGSSDGSDEWGGAAEWLEVSACDEIEQGRQRRIECGWRRVIGGRYVNVTNELSEVAREVGARTD